MASDRSDATRRKVLQTAVAVLCCTATKSIAATTSSATTIDQITDVGSTAAKDMFRFEPNFVKLLPGDELVFLNSKSQHTVHSVSELWPEGSERVSIAHQPEAVVTFDREGFYGFRCKRHGQYGMVMLVVVGSPENARETRSIVETMRAKKRERDGFAELLDRYEQV